jgi:hypothetical protein
MSGNISVPPNNIIRTQISALSTYLATSLLSSTSLSLSALQSNIQNYLQSYVNSNQNIQIPLSGIAIDYETNKAELEQLLTNQPESPWIDNITAATGAAIIQMIATSMTYLQYNIIRAAQESMMDTAILDNSIYANTRNQGVNIIRNSPAFVNATLTWNNPNDTSFSIPPYSSFSIGNIPFFNRDTILFKASTSSVTINVILYQ